MKNLKEAIKEETKKSTIENSSYSEESSNEELEWIIWSGLTWVSELHYNRIY